MPTVLESIGNYFRNISSTHNAPELLAHWSAGMETQINVAMAGGEPVASHPGTYSDGDETWFNVRIPKGSADSPHWTDYTLSYPLDKYVEAIGSTGWKWDSRTSIYLGYDFDSITSHAAGVGVTRERLEEIQRQAAALEFVEVRKSTGGSGLHLYVYLETGENAVTTANHTEHAALARSVLTILSTETGFDFAQHVDVCGGNMWLWHRKMTAANEGLKLIKAASRPLKTSELPANWRDHADVVTRKRPRVQVAGMENGTEAAFEKLSAGRKIVPLDDQHKNLIKTLATNGDYAVWLGDHHLLQTHTLALAKIFQQQPFPVRGVFKTASRGSSALNCFCFPLPDGAWKVVRFGRGGVAEHKTWTQDSHSWTYCYFNRAASLKIASYAHNGVLDPETQEFVFTDYESAVETVLALGDRFELPVTGDFRNREIRLKTTDEGHLLAKIPRKESDEHLPGWIAKKTKWVRGFESIIDQPTTGEILFDYDNLVRTLVTPKGESIGWMMRNKDGVWNTRPKDDLKNLLASHGLGKPQIDQVLGAAIENPWTLVNVPFQPEYIGDRQWNRGAAQFAYTPAQIGYDDVGRHPHWDMILSHIGADLNDELSKSEWAQHAKIKTGRDYLVAWIAAMLREPFEQLPYLFLYGPENSGKSILHESIEMLMSGGVVSGKNALSSQSEFNGELANAVLCWVEEKDLGGNKGAHARMKEWVTAKRLAIRPMRTTTYMQPNTTHWIQNANSVTHVPLFPGDTRVVVLYVPRPDVEIAKHELMRRLADEAPNFMHTLLHCELPPSDVRLRIPVVATESKRHAEALNRNDLERYISESCAAEKGQTILFKDFYNGFHAWLSEEDKGEWTRKKAVKAMPPQFPCRIGHGNRKTIYDIVWRGVALDSE